MGEAGQDPDEDVLDVVRRMSAAGERDQAWRLLQTAMGGRDPLIAAAAAVRRQQEERMRESARPVEGEGERTPTSRRAPGGGGPEDLILLTSPVERGSDPLGRDGLVVGSAAAGYALAAGRAAGRGDTGAGILGMLDEPGIGAGGEVASGSGLTADQRTSIMFPGVRLRQGPVQRVLEEEKRSRREPVLRVATEGKEPGLRAAEAWMSAVVGVAVVVVEAPEAEEELEDEGQRVERAAEAPRLSTSRGSPRW
jgi:hypothetical protein